MRIVTLARVSIVLIAIVGIAFIAYSRLSRRPDGPPARPQHMTTKEYYDFFIRQEQLETTNIHTRLTWGLTVQGFLFAALALIARERRTSVTTALKIALPVVGVTTGLATLAGAVAGLLTLGALEAQWGRWMTPLDYPAPYATDEVVGFMGSVPGWFVPLAIVLTWVYIDLKLNAPGAQPPHATPRRSR